MREDCREDAGQIPGLTRRHDAERAVELRKRGVRYRRMTEHLGTGTAITCVVL